MARKEGRYEELCKEVLENSPKAMIKEIFCSDYCELELDFLGFLEEYEALSHVVPKNMSVLDLGCYAGLQAYFFRNDPEDKRSERFYIGVDAVKMYKQKDPDKFYMPRAFYGNTFHYTLSIQKFVEMYEEGELFDIPKERIFAICNYVPDKEARKLVEATFPNRMVYYPGEKEHPGDIYMDNKKIGNVKDLEKQLNAQKFAENKICEEAEYERED